MYGFLIHIAGYSVQQVRYSYISGLTEQHIRGRYKVESVQSVIRRVGRGDGSWRLGDTAECTSALTWRNTDTKAMLMVGRAHYAERTSRHH